MTENSFELDLLTGFAEVWRDAAGKRTEVAWNPDPLAAYPTGEDDPMGIYLDVWPEVQHGTITLADYTVSDDPSLSDSVIGIQVMVKHLDRSVVKAATSDLFDLFHGRAGGMLGTVKLVSAMRASGTNAGQDSNERQGRIENYYLTVHRPSPNRL